ncbi:E1 [Eidolon helvum papillomavirus 3]|uniref:Replication protein E1 n=1 Tax=Eidolon helvum papillomavirus 3 TaxID=1335477 RepID=A0A1P8YVU2_9PAPI|nr:E1 [Eidolon helvum papillomavirus 3]AQA28211.1 E1 [Eidolon helvum papillomavirus 3]
MATSGTDTDPQEGPSGEGFLDREADCSEGGETDEDEGSEASNVSDLIDDDVDEVDNAQGNTLALFQQQQAEDDEKLVSLLKRKHHCTPDTKDLQGLSPRLDAMRISPQRSRVAKKRLFKPGDDSGVELTLTLTNEAADTPASENTLQVEGTLEGRTPGEGQESESTPQSDSLTETPTDPGSEGTGSSQPEPVREGEVLDFATAILRSSNRKACMYARFKELYGIGFNDLVRKFKSDKTCAKAWVIVLYALGGPLYECLKTVLPDHCTYTNMQLQVGRQGGVALMLAEFKTAKSRETVHKLFKSICNASEELMLCEPPNVRSSPAALYWVQKGTTKVADTTGNYPDWIAKQTMISHIMAENTTFDFGVMVQWAYDNNIVEEANIAYQYALYAEEDKNARAWLMTSTQAKHVRDCAVMVRYYKQAEMQDMSMSEWIWSRCKLVSESTGDWKTIVQFLRHQGVEVIPFLRTFRDWLKAIPKRNTICIHGPPNTGKSMFGMSLMKFMSGAVLSYVNSRSQFWLQPIVRAKVAMLDDATGACWTYINVYLRNMLDGNPISVDMKHKAPLQTVCPPLLITSNINISEDENHKYLHSRVKCISFPCPLQLGADGRPTVLITNAHWKSFFEKFTQHLELTPPEEEEDSEHGSSQRAFRCAAREDTEAL